MSVLDIAMAVADLVTAALPRPRPHRNALEQCRIISHRGEHDNRRVMENTLQAFHIARDAGVWGIECDVRFTADLVPVICHDPSPQRVFGEPRPLATLSFDELRRACPLIPSLAEVVREFGGGTHLMLELKAEPWPAPARQRDSLREALAQLTPVQHYHLLSLDPAMFERADFVPAAGCLPVAELNVKAISALALARGYAGLGGHYLLLGRGLMRRHGRAGQWLGTGFPASGNCLRRELNRGVRQIFSNEAVKLQRLRDAMLDEAKAAPGLTKRP